MIGDLLSTLAKAQKLDINQIHTAVQDGTLPAYVGVPLLQQKMQQRQEAEALLAGQKQQKLPPIADQVMQAASQLNQPQPMAAPPAPQVAAPAPAPAADTTATSKPLAQLN